MAKLLTQNRIGVMMLMMAWALGAGVIFGWRGVAVVGCFWMGAIGWRLARASRR